MAKLKGVSDISKEITKALQEYTLEVTEGLDQAKLLVARDTVKKLKKAGKFEDVTGDYRKGWRQKKVGTARIIHNATDYQLTHLLENGHVTRGGTGRTQSYPHIRPAEQDAIKEYIDKTEKVIRG